MKVFVSAGEVSGDLMLSRILARLKNAHPDLVVAGLGGEASSAFGLEPLYPMSRTAVSGVGDVLRAAPFLLRMARGARRALESGRGGHADLALLVDYPGLNLRLAERARKLGIPVLFVAPPQAWAYRRARQKAERAARYLQGCAVQVLFPFEVDTYREAASKVLCGHFLEEEAEPMGAAPGMVSRPRGLLALGPGSRLPVLRRNLPPWLRALRQAGLLPGSAASPVAEVQVLVPPHLAAEARALIAAEGVGLEAVGTVTDKGRLLREARWAIAFPGTFTLELAWNGVPAATVAVLDPLTLKLGRWVLKSGRLGLPNLILDHAGLPEWAGTATDLTGETLRGLWEGLAGLEGQATRERLREAIGPGRGAELAAAECLKILEASQQKREPRGFPAEKTLVSP